MLILAGLAAFPSLQLVSKQTRWNFESICLKRIGDYIPSRIAHSSSADWAPDGHQSWEWTKSTQLWLWEFSQSIRRFMTPSPWTVDGKLLLVPESWYLFRRPAERVDGGVDQKYRHEGRAAARARGCISLSVTHSRWYATYPAETCWVWFPSLASKRHIWAMTFVWRLRAGTSIPMGQGGHVPQYFRRDVV